MIPKIPAYNNFKKLGEGGMAVVWYAENALGKPFAIKLLNQEMVGKEKIVERFRNEAKLMVGLNHPNIRQVISYYEDESTMAIIMEYLEGQDLGKYLTTYGAVPEAMAVRWFNDILDAMTYVHRKGYIHRDIKPSNLFLTSGGQMKIMDFGIAKIVDSTQELTQISIGSPQYMSPEQVLTPKSIDLRTDIYSLGVTLYALLTGKKPYNDSYSSSYTIQTEITKNPLPYIQGVSSALNAAIQKATSKDSNYRFQSCEEFKAALNEPDSLDSDHIEVEIDERPPVIPPSFDHRPPVNPIPIPVYDNPPVRHYPEKPKSNIGRNIIIAVVIIIAVFGGLVLIGLQIEKSEINKGVGLYEEKNYTEAFNLLYKNRGSSSLTPQAMHDLGYMYDTGNGTQQDYTEAREWYEKAADKGIPMSMNNLGVMYRYGSGVDKDYSRARSLFERAAAEGVHLANYNLGDLYENGLGVEANLYRAFNYYSKAAKEGHAASQYRLGLMYALGKGVSTSNSEAVAWFRKSAEQGYAEGQYGLGYMYGAGYVTGENDYDAAIAWFEKAADQNEPRALYYLGQYYEYGYGKSKDWSTALSYYKKSAQLGNENAQKILTGYGYSWR
ncbi:serine/threonine-protein kinase [Spirosoma panaciterrae]|uniref:serine/threonine-protein kinase n=1 Tax=Spirosoma panaciterrae TaxID=496058 RepID=UPI000364EB75|nr:serine/threonine-protein kinase [Spirosoma panaciterrae]